MSELKYIIGIDQSTQGTKALLFDQNGRLLLRTDKSHRQIVNDKGWVSHDLDEIYHNTLETVKQLFHKSGINSRQIAGIGISNQRETTAVWDRDSGKPLDDAIVWQCKRAGSISQDLKKRGYAEIVREKTGIPLSPYFPAPKMSWLLQKKDNTDSSIDRTRLAGTGKLCLGTIDSWLIYKLTNDHVFRTDYSNASRTQLFNIHSLKWDEELCRIFGVPMICLPEVCGSDEIFGYTRMGGLFDKGVPICGVLGDSHGALFGQGCQKPGMIKATYGTGSSLMLNTGENLIQSTHGMVTSLAWKRSGKVNYVLEGNLNYTGAVISWMKDDLGLIVSADETEGLAFLANPGDTTYLVPAFTGLGAPYWDENARACISGMSRLTGKAEIVKAGLDCIAYQITDLLTAMELDTNQKITELRVDGGPTKNKYLMQFQSDIADKKISVPYEEELSGIGAAYMAGISAGLYEEDKLFGSMDREFYHPAQDRERWEVKYEGWKATVHMLGQHFPKKM
ncbi:glycerol kinase GlpK [Blautia liquoris]|uniref:Glycerol kinase GlpK n=1 Tax=Blautia liquoris TaxID=2779518 RepID=A0A7M2RIV9_9FIRM|nr:glycerol kinase [Blautia liquoris]QOV20266.1 glycerol kinase GlpK [Blautia liquoris]